MLNIAILGLGWWGRHIITTLENSSIINVVAAASRTVDKHKKFATEKNIILYEDYNTLLNDPLVDGIVLCTPNTQHEEQVKKAAYAGKQIFCEKPLALTKNAAENIISYANKFNLVLGVGHERRFDPAIEELSKIIKSKQFGKKMHIEANWSHDILAALDSNNWRGSLEEAPAGGMTGTGVHMTDLFLSLFGTVESIFAQTANQVLDFKTGDITVVLMKFTNGATGQLSVISKTPYYCRLSAFGDNMWAEVRDTKHPMYGAKNQLLSCAINKEPISKVFPAVNTIKANLEEWALSITQNKKYRFNDIERVQNVAILEAITKSAKDNNWTKV
ncbi:Gfo/Idh/MocA family oxidoreductase [Hyphomicrobiales bacterium]|jgi:predicted dehydrogenase|nr:Gfo/Idh/MocA family oxidoreductase [Rhodobiaceae bacterium]MDB4831403.1 Gfo/Idh/MocA family oxidoreductase [Hyphomicrobiales bacterium]MBT5640086.1 Gfo/Idh/MocA family oxidoreductase [Rhodobiaceae bacterium]MBT6222718.1 Gfo/Idh/MocA family oxidoreductase [Rhodobiaceae bacterium]MDC0139918.1 Gfo/Idh/MocA family oxidoreductase [Hyphomicrobiales bacterium]|tara:strand:+ start:1460 stop:2452 length:993 start_codon:yes stop_codon:yes gene_type:complete